MSTPLAIPISDKEFELFQRLVYELAGIKMAPSKKALVSGRLGRRLRHYGLESFEAYYRLVMDGREPGERQVMVDLLTTNETHFFREPKHFEFLRERVLAQHHGEMRVWSAACSSGEEPYSLAMTLEEALGAGRWRVLATDISTRVLEAARAGIYPIEDAERLPASYVTRYCLKGVRNQAGSFTFNSAIKNGIDFHHLNLNGEWPRLERFHVVFLRNVMIYFDTPVKKRLVERIADQLLPGGYLVIGHSENLHGVTDRYETVIPSVYRVR